LRTISSVIEAALESGAAKLCQVWIVTRKDGVRLGFTDHDRDLTVAGVVCRAASGFSAGAATSELGLGAGSSSAVAGVIDSDSLSAADIASGLYDEADIEVYTVDWREPSQNVLTFAGRLARFEARGGLRNGEASFVAHIEGPAARLERIIGRRVSPLCDAVLGDVRCGVNHPVQPVCDKRFSTCRSVFGNGHRFRGFPDLPGEDFLSVYPRAGDIMDGLSRRVRR
jgi:hypothetical protein